MQLRPDQIRSKPRRGRVLLVGAHLTHTRRHLATLEAAGFSVTTADDSGAAFQLKAGGEFDAMVHVVEMPPADRRGVVERVREIDPDLPVLLLSSFRTLDAAMFALDHRVFCMLTEPVGEPALVAAITEAVEHGAIARARRAALTRAELDASAVVSLRHQFAEAISTLWMAYQPIVRSATGASFAYEALVRTDELSLPDPKVLLIAAERLQVLPLLGRAIRANVAHTLDESPFDVFVNLHPTDLEDPELFAADAPLSRHAHRVVFEITERTSLEVIHEPHKRIATLRALGFRFAIDDLGAGYAGLSSIAALEPEIFKIDMSLVRGIEMSATRRALVRLLVVMAKEIGAEVIAEGIETEEERAVLTALGCDLMQGYLFGRPVRCESARHPVCASVP